MCSGRTPMPMKRAMKRRKRGLRGEESEEQGWFDGGGVAEGADEQVVDDDLKGLGDACGEFAAALDVGEGELGDDAGLEGGGEDAGGGDGVLNGEVDADAADGRHGVGGVADAEQAGAVPAGEAVDLDGEKLDLVPVGDLVDAVGEEGDEADEGVAEGVRGRRAGCEWRRCLWR